MFTKYQYAYTLPQTNSTVKGYKAFYPPYKNKTLLSADRFFSKIIMLLLKITYKKTSPKAGLYSLIKLIKQL